MKRTGFYYKVEARLELSSEDLEILFYCSRSHYDSRCQEASEPNTRDRIAAKGSIWTAFCNWLGFDKIRDFHESLYQEWENRGELATIRKVLKKFPEQKCEVFWDWDTLDLLCKILEGVSFITKQTIGLDEEASWALSGKINEAFREVRTEQNSLNKKEAEKALI